VSGYCNDVCLAACTFEADSCPATHSCSEYSDYFDDEGEALAGVCTLGCDPVAQVTNLDEPCPEGDGCFVFLSHGQPIANCVQERPINAIGQDQPIVGMVYGNSCAAGLTNILDENGDPICTAFCTPVETYSGSSLNLAGEAPHTCGARGANTHECRFLWYFRPEYTAINPLFNRVGVCVDITDRLYDSNNNGSPETPWPSCADLPNTDTDADGVPQHEEWGCAPRAH
jgi:hypothetical protein